jgi:hypothetical protein
VYSFYAGTVNGIDMSKALTVIECPTSTLTNSAILYQGSDSLPSTLTYSNLILTVDTSLETKQ